MKRSEALYPRDIVEHAAVIAKRIAGRSIFDFTQDETMRDGVLYHLIIIGEAASHVAPETRQAYDVPWADIRRFRNFVVHEFFGIELEIAWRTAVVRVPALAIFEGLEQSDDPQRRGIILQNILNQLFKANDIPVARSFTRNDGGGATTRSFVPQDDCGGGWLRLSV